MRVMLSTRLLLARTSWPSVLRDDGSPQCAQHFGLHHADVDDLAAAIERPVARHRRAGHEQARDQRSDAPLDRYDDLGAPSLDLHVAQSQRVADDRHRAKAHRDARRSSAQQQAEGGIEHACGDRHAERVVDEREAEVLLHVGARSPRTAGARARCRAGRP